MTAVSRDYYTDASASTSSSTPEQPWQPFKALSALDQPQESPHTERHEYKIKLGTVPLLQLPHSHAPLNRLASMQALSRNVFTR